jgi:hypothetical protein
MPLVPLRTLVLAALLPALAGCLQKDKLATVPDAENLLQTSDGRLLVSGGTGVVEIRAQGTGHVAVPVASEAGTCVHTGLAQIGDWVFTACQKGLGLLGAADNHLLAARLVAGQPLHFLQVERASPDPMDSLALPNGLAATPDGRLLIADYNLFAAAGVARAGLSFGVARPRLVTFEPNWLSGSHGVFHPNGVRVSGQELFVSDVSFVKRYRFDAAGQVPLYLDAPNGRRVKNEVLVYQQIGIVDDIQPHCGGVVVTDFTGGRLVYMAPAGTGAHGLPSYRQALASPLQSLQQPSAVVVGRAPLFDGHDVLVTEKGLLFDFGSPYGNRLSRVKASIDLNDPAGCAQLNAS